jgi:hypothetical protein
MDFVLSKHAERKMELEGITAAMIEEALERPIWEVPTSRNTRYDAMNSQGRRYGVVVALEHTPAVVVTVFWFR